MPEVGRKGTGTLPELDDARVYFGVTIRAFMSPPFFLAKRRIAGRVIEPESLSGDWMGSLGLSTLIIVL
jgi:hypothetical protein